ncbi:hypothetical protein JCM16774_0523 [Pseudoleptotrichia goodfellowii]|uniref:Uncharacterized protein n=1 Tax=Pseudoleptotrichia goodfellowii TaxID=157692 RepID=A0A510J8K6_9FUSO|nr:hypothetical protein JCM16774_0523 [Pseudoleptotrichia goodfellowii]
MVANKNNISYFLIYVNTFFEKNNFFVNAENVNKIKDKIDSEEKQGVTLFQIYLKISAN